MTDQIKNVTILGLAILCAILFLTRGCGNPFGGFGLDNNCPDPKVIIKEVKVEGTIDDSAAPIPEPVETFSPIPPRGTILVSNTSVDKSITILSEDTLKIYHDWMAKREYEVERADSNLNATIRAVVQYNRLQSVELDYNFTKENHTVLYDRFQFHVLGKVGVDTDFDAQFRPKLGVGGLMEFRSGTGAGAAYGYSIGSPMPHEVELLVTQRISFRKRRK